MEAEFPASIICTGTEAAERSKAEGSRLPGRGEAVRVQAVNDPPPSAAVNHFLPGLGAPSQGAWVDVNNNMSRKVSSFQKCESNDNIT